MKKNLTIFILAAALMVAQACGSKSEKTSEESVVAETPTPAVKPVVLTSAEKRAKIENERAARAEKRRIEFEKQAKIAPYYTDSKGNIVYNKAEVDPSFTGGDKAMMKYLRDNLKFPEDAQKEGLEGTVFVDFVVAANGAVREVTVTETPGEEVDQSFRTEAIRVVTSMPKWIPGRQRGKSVDVKFSLPVTFQMI